MFRNLNVLLALSCLHVACSQPAVEIIDRVRIDLRDADGGSLKATFELRSDQSPENQVGQFCNLYFLPDDQCSVLKSRAIKNYNLYHEELHLVLTTPDDDMAVIGTVPLILFTPEGGESEVDFLLKDTSDAILQGVWIKCAKYIAV